MRTRIPLYYRLSHKYATGWDHLDDWLHLATATEKSTDPVSWDHLSEDSRKTRVLVTMTAAEYAEARRRHRQYRIKGKLNATLTRAIEDTYAHSCTCEHDCCGHKFGHETAVQTKRREWVVTVYEGINV